MAMFSKIRASHFMFAVAMIALGITGLVNGEFARGQQMIPLQHLPAEDSWAYATAVVEVLIGTGLLFRPTLVAACRALVVFMLLWLVLLELPWVIRTPLVQGPWAGISEKGAIMAGAWCLFASFAGPWEKQHLGFLVDERGIRIARFLLIVSLPMLGLDVLIHRYDFSYQPWLAWLPHPSAWIHLTGVGSLAAFFALLFGVLPRLAATMEAAMMWLITIAYWAPALPTGQTATTAFVASALIATGIWLVADTYRSVPWLASGGDSRRAVSMMA
jgi:uncharacterized membrane protein YphA (DoxX/SURF4 family)